MKKIFLSALFYLMGIISMFFYVFMELRPRLLMSPINKIAILGGTWLFIYFGSRLLSKNKPCQKELIMKHTFAVFFILYSILLLDFTLFDRMFARGGISRTIFSAPDMLEGYLKYSFNLIPFATIYEYITSFLNHTIHFSVIVTNLFGNLVAFMPMALFLPMLLKKCRKIIHLIRITAISVISIELLQLIFVTGSFDIDDLILNMTGVVIAFGILHLKPVHSFLQKITILEF